MNYHVDDHTKRGKVFETLEEANAYANEIMRKTGIVYMVHETEKEVTHTYNLDSK